MLQQGKIQIYTVLRFKSYSTQQHIKANGPAHN